MDIADKISQFKKRHPHVNSEEINSLVQSVAENCMQSIVDNENFNGRGANAWWSIKDSFNIEINDMDKMLPINRLPSDEITGKFMNACSEQDIELIKECLIKGAQINGSNNTTSALTDAVMVGNLDTLKFFIESDFINNNPYYKSQVSFDKVKGELFSLAYFIKNIEVLTYLINDHHAETTNEAFKQIKQDDSEFKMQVIKIINNKHLNYMLELTLPEKIEVKNKMKI